MRIAHLVSTFPPYKGGMGNVCFYQARELAKLGHHVTVFAPQFKRGRSSDFPEVRPPLRPDLPKRSDLPESEPKLCLKRSDLSEKSKGLALFEVRRVKPFIRCGNAALLPQLVKVLKDFDIVHLHYPFFGAAEFIWLARTFGYGNRTPLVLQYHMDVVGRDIRRFFFGFHNKFTLPRIIKVSNKVIASSMDYLLHSSIKELVRKNPEHFTEIPLGVDGKLFYPEEKDKELLNKYNLSSDTQIILFVGGLDRAHYFKGVDILIKAFASLTPYTLHPTPYTLIIIGEGELKKDYIKLTEKLGVGDSVIFAGEVPQENLVKYYNLADILVLPSIDQSEAFGLVLVEAAACGKPAIASNLPGVRTVIENEKTGLLVKPGSVEDLKEKLEYLLTNISVQQKFGQAGRRKVEKIYTWSKIGQQLNGLYQSLKR